MTKSILQAIGIAIVAVIALAALAQDTFHPVALSPEDLVWDTERSNHRATISGSNETPGMYVYRTRFSDGFRNTPHYHPDNRVGTVMSGTLQVGHGEEFDESIMQPITMGGMWTEPAGQAHFVWAKDGPVVIQIVGEGPSGTIQINP